MRAVIVGGIVTLVCTITIYANQINPDRSVTPGISIGGLVGLSATWIMVTFGYWNIKRTIKNDAKEEIATQIQTALYKYDEKIQEEFSKRLATCSDKEVQNEINKRHDEQYKSLMQFSTLVANIDSMTQAILRRAERIEKEGK